MREVSQGEREIFFDSKAGVEHVRVLLQDLAARIDHDELPQRTVDALDAPIDEIPASARKAVDAAIVVLRSYRIVEGKAGGRGRGDRVSPERAAQLFAEAFVGPILMRWRDRKRSTKTGRRVPSPAKRIQRAP